MSIVDTVLHKIFGTPHERKVKQLRPVIAKIHEARAALEALDDAAHVEATRKMNAEGIEVLTREFTALGFKVLPTQANFICVKIGERARELVSFLEKNGMIVRGLTSFGMPEYIRVTIGKPEENEFLVMLVKKWKAEA